MIKTYREQLEEVQKAISEVLTGAQEATYNGQRVRKADLDMLQKREEWLVGKITSQNRGGIRARIGVPV